MIATVVLLLAMLFWPSARIPHRHPSQTPVSTYHQGISIKPKTRVNKLDALKEIIRGWGLNPEEILTRDAMREPHRTVIDRSELENHQSNQLTSALKQQMLKEMRENQPENSINSCSAGNSPGEI